jgi:hypothetical protein
MAAMLPFSLTRYLNLIPMHEYIDILDLLLVQKGFKYRERKFIGRAVETRLYRRNDLYLVLNCILASRHPRFYIELIERLYYQALSPGDLESTKIRIEEIDRGYYAIT